jgi:hypothetical protein
MLIQAISSGTSSLSVLNPVSAAKSTATSSSDTAASSSTIDTVSINTSSSSTTSSTASSSGSSSSGGGSSSSSSSKEMQVTSYSTTVAGKQYSGSVQESNGEYTASVSGLAGASASGSSITAAENNLTTRINEIV